MEPYFSDGEIKICHGDAWRLIPGLGQFDLVLTDPPYSSGGAMRSDRSQPASQKYQHSEAIKKHAGFSGDNRDQRSFEKWCAYWMGEALNVTRDGGVLGCFIDWRNLPSLVDAIQIAGWVFRGIVPWDKTEASRPLKGWFRSQCEYLVLGSNGPIDRNRATDGICNKGCFRYPVPRNKKHLTEKPVELLEDIIRTRDDWKRVLDPFMGSGTTLLAAQKLGRAAVGIELDANNCEIAADRLRQETLALSG